MNSPNVDPTSPTDDALARLHRDGATVWPAAFSAAQIAWAREVVLRHRDCMPNTRPTPSARHMAGFERLREFAPLHELLTGNAAVQSLIGRVCGPDARTIGLSDITVNRSQQWHKDLLRGRFQHYLGAGPWCPRWHGTVIKVILYLQDSASLKIVPGSHRQDLCLDGDEHAIPADDTPVTALPVRAGDAVFIDICTTHRGSTEDAFADPQAAAEPKILVSTVYGRGDAPLTGRMERGNQERLSAWWERHFDGAALPSREGAEQVA